MTEAVCALLGEALITSPGRASRLLSYPELHQLPELSGGSVYLRRQDWKIVAHRRGRYARIELRKE